MQDIKTMRRSKGIALFVSLCLTLAIFTQVAAAGNDGMVLLKLNGEVDIRQGQTVTWQKAKPGSVIHPGDVVRTGSKSWAIIHHRSAKIQLYENTLLEFPIEQSSQKVSEAGGGLATVVLQKGHSIFKVFKNRIKRRFEVITPSLIAGVKGTVFEVFEKDTFKGVAVSEGIVEVVNLDFRNEIMEVRADHYTEIRDFHLTLPKEHLGEDLLRNEKHHEEKPKDHRIRPLNEGFSEMRTDRKALSAGLKDDRKELTAELKDDRKELTAELKDDRKELTAELKDDRKELAAELKDDRKELTAELKDDQKELTAELKDDQKELTAELKDDRKELTAEVQDDLKDQTLARTNGSTDLGIDLPDLK